MGKLRRLRDKHASGIIYCSIMTPVWVGIATMGWCGYQQQERKVDAMERMADAAEKCKDE